MFRVLWMYSKTKVTKLGVMLRGEIVQKYKRKHRDAYPAKSSFVLAMQGFTKLLKRNKQVLQKGFTYVSCKMVTVILNYL